MKKYLKTFLNGFTATSMGICGMSAIQFCCASIEYFLNATGLMALLWFLHMLGCAVLGFVMLYAAGLK